MAVITIIRARREKERLFYLGVVADFLLALIAISVLLKQILIASLLIALGSLFLIVAWPKLVKLSGREYTKTLKEVDLSAPLRMREFFTMKGWLKLASGWGVWKTVLLFWFFNVAGMGGGLFLTAIFLGIEITTFAVTYTVLGSTFLPILFYRQIKELSVLRGSK